MAEGWAKALKGDKHHFYSAGIATHGLNPNAIKVMAEAGVDISTHTSDHASDLVWCNRQHAHIAKRSSPSC